MPGDVSTLAPHFPSRDERNRQEKAPGKEPDQVQTPEEISRQLVVVHRDALAKEAQEVFVDEVEPEEAMAVHASGVAQAGEDVPRGSDGEEEEQACEWLQRAPFLVVAGHGQIDDSGTEDEDRGYQTFGEDREGKGNPHGIRVETR